MSRKHIIILILGLVLPLMAFSQTDVALDPEFGGRVAVSVDKKIAKGLHIYLEEEVRFDNNFGSLDRLQTTLALNYKVHPNIKLGLGYRQSFERSKKQFSQPFRHLRRFSQSKTPFVLFVPFDVKNTPKQGFERSKSASVREPHNLFQLRILPDKNRLVR